MQITQDDPETKRLSEILRKHGVAINAQKKAQIENKLRSGRTPELLFGFAECLRAEGALSRAAEYYDEASASPELEQRCKYLEAVCLQKKTGAISGGSGLFTPAPFSMRDGFLDISAQRMLQAQFTQLEEKMIPAKVGSRKKGHINQSTRSAWTVSGPAMKPVRKAIVGDIEKALMEALTLFGYESEAGLHITMNFTSYHDRGFYGQHTDAGEGHPRILSYIYYFHEMPKKFSGGELELFDTSFPKEEINGQATLIAPVNNRLVIFPS
ncbi:MAG: 2OG-Fe(II) oxygenase [Lentilitoribacter sp.]